MADPITVFDRHILKLRRDRAAKRGAAARAAIEPRFSPAASGARYRRRLEAIATG